jgi:hypothetical protein
VRDTSALGRRYRRLLAAYPPEHRRVHGEEMIGVLLTTARPRHRRPRRQRAPRAAVLAGLPVGVAGHLRPALMTGFALPGMRRSTAATALAVTAAAQFSDLSASVTYFASAGLV